MTFVPKHLSVVGNKRISQFFDSASEPRSQVLQNLFPKVSDSVYIDFIYFMSACHDRVGDLTLFEALTGGAYERQNWQHSREFDQNFSNKIKCPGVCPGGGGIGRFWN